MLIDSPIKIIRALAKGVDPNTGEELHADCPCRHPDTIRALITSLHILESIELEMIRKQRKKKKPPENAGTPWTNEEDARLRSAFQADKTVSQLAKDHKRTSGSIVGRLGLYGLVTHQYGAKCH